MSKGRSLHIGLNYVDPSHYQGWDGELGACEYDARDMCGIAVASGMSATTLITSQATRAAVLAEIRAAAKELHSSDLFFLSYSGHGGQVPDASGDESDGRDETWCLYDGQLIDDELYSELARFQGVRILVLSDSCHSGTVVRAMPDAMSMGRHRRMPHRMADATYAANRELYDGIQAELHRSAGDVEPDEALAHMAVKPRRSKIVSKFAARVILLSGCQDNQTSLDGGRNGAFTEALLGVWDGGAFEGDYRRFHDQIKTRMPPYQTPNLCPIRAVAFLKERPFEV